MRRQILYMLSIPGIPLTMADHKHKYDKEKLKYNLLIFKATECIQGYLKDKDVDLNSLKSVFCKLKPDSEEIDREIHKATTVDEFWLILEKHHFINMDDVSLLESLAKHLDLRDLQKAIDLYCSKGVAYAWDAVLHLKTELFLKNVPGALILSGALVALCLRNRDLWDRLSEVLPPLVNLIGVTGGCITFTVTSSSLSSFKELWSSYNDGSLQVNIQKVLNDTKEVKDVFNGEEIDVEVTIDEDEYRDACWHAVLMQMTDRYKSTGESSSVGQEHRQSSCDMDLPTTTMAEIAWHDWIEVKEIYNEAKKRRKVEIKVAELGRKLQILEKEKQSLEREGIIQFQKELQRIEHEQEEVSKESMSLKNKLEEVKSKLQAEQELLSSHLDPLLKSKQEEMLKVFEQLTTDLINKEPGTVELAERLISELSRKIFSHPSLSVHALMQMMQENSKVLKNLPWDDLHDDSRLAMVSGIETIMNMVTERLINHPDLSADALIQVMHENTEILKYVLPWYGSLDDGSKIKVISVIEDMKNFVTEKFGNHPDLSPNVLIQVMQENTKVLQNLPWNDLHDDSRPQLISGIDTMMNMVTERLVNNSDLSTAVLIQVLQENTKVLLRLSWTSVDDDSRLKLISGIGTMMTSVTERLVNHSDLSTDGLIQVMKESTKVLENLPWFDLHDDSRLKLITDTEKMVTLVTEQLVRRTDLCTDVLIQVLQENTKVLEKLPWRSIDDNSSLMLSSGIAALMNMVTERLVNLPDVSSDVMIQVMQENTKVLENLPWDNLDDGIKNMLTSDLESRVKLLIKHLSNHPEIKDEVFQGIICISKVILEKISWTDLNSVSQNHVLACLDELMILVSERASDEKRSEFCDMHQVIRMMLDALGKLKDGNELSSESVLVIVSIASRMITSYLGQQSYKSVWTGRVSGRPRLDHYLMDLLSHLLIEARGLLSQKVTASSDVTKLKSQVDIHIDTLDRVLLNLNDILVKSTESVKADEVVSDIKHELSEFKKELANMVNIFERKTKHGLEFQENLQALIDKMEMKCLTQGEQELEEVLIFYPQRQLELEGWRQ